jgi:signal transduction histidine kinase/ligand-binding sensor domain-containing protein
MTLRSAVLTAPPSCPRLRRAAAFVLGTALAVLHPAPARALDPGKPLGAYTVEVWGMRDGLYGASVRGIDQTADGYLWIASYGGVARYDGSRIVHLPVEPPGDMGGIAADQRGVLYIVPRRGAIRCAHRDRLVPCPSAVPALNGETPTFNMNRDRAGTIWMSGVKRVMAANLRGEAANAAIMEGPFGNVAAVARDPRDGDRLWVAGTEGLFVGRRGDFQRFVGRDGPVAESTLALAEGRGGTLWALTERALMRIERADATSHALPARTDMGTQPRQILEDRDGSVWIGTGNGLQRFRNGRFEVYTRADGLPDDDVTALFEDREGSLWLGTRSGSLAQLTDRTVASTHGPPSLRFEPIESVCEDPTGAFWFGTRLGLTRWKDGVERTFTQADGVPGERVYATYPAAGGEIWVGATNGLARWRHDTQRLERPFPFTETVFSLYQDRQGLLWIGTDRGLHRADPRRRSVEPVPATGNFQPGQIRGLQEDAQGVLWVTSVGGLARVQRGDGAGLRLQPVLEGTRDVARADRGIVRDRDGTLWFGAGTTLVRLRDGRFRSFGAAEGLPRDWLFQVLPDDLGYIWFATARTISRVALRDLETIDGREPPRVPVTSFDTSDSRREIAARRSRTPGAWKGRDGRLWFATLRGVVTIDPTDVKVNPLPPTVLIENAQVDGRPAEVDRDNDFPPGAGNLEFHFAGVTLLEPRRTNHRYRLEGFDQGWVDAGTRRVAYYTNISPGTYRFRVQASNADGVWNEAGATLSLRLRPHFYRTGWFYGLCVLALAALGSVFYRSRLLRLRGQYLAVFAERSRVARELHDSLLQGMSAVALELENIRGQLPGTASDAASRLETVENALNDSLEETRRFVWNLREQKNASGDLGLALSRLAGRLAEGRSVECRVQVLGEAVHLSHEQQGTLFRVAQEALANALKHAQPRRIDVKLRYQPETVELTVTDDGRGFSVEEAQGPNERHFGLTGMRERARKLGASLHIDSRPAAGTTVKLAVPRADRRSRHV